MYTGISVDCTPVTCVPRPQITLKCGVLFLQNSCSGQWNWQSSNLMLLCMLHSWKEAFLLFSRYQLIILFLRKQIGPECSYGFWLIRNLLVVLCVISSFT